jgi:2-C-methyl-D-erythritol 4-phosphate cytidylyltransferase
MQVQTPQGFWAERIIAAHRQAKQSGFYATDDAALVEKFFPEQCIKIFETGYHNLKITTPEDLDLAKAMLKRLLRS